jgi:hypothetical protein
MSINVSVSNRPIINAKISAAGNQQTVSSSTIFVGATDVQNEVNMIYNQSNTSFAQSNLALSQANTALLEITEIANGYINLAIVDAGTF